MREAQWTYLGLALLLGLLLGALFYWWVIDSHQVATPNQATATQQSQPAVPSTTARAHAAK